ncbi:Nucleotide-binding universal stress protein, UspA family [Humidesulfovibrio mexicanus]|uniref:Nucleotide-binding universal stress protein, UspA family n=1 Tax=Humidesulfovibrio mexicanus TaxID=147047 RepID=A0A239CFW0_9BACT|nr:universal stress protein [Humidesulfovibrio mexicanus]SNS18990.1 Nucleotide-binding universal stress protein, UspA family [Humidesulfovibrio mexicanus]
MKILMALDPFGDSKKVLDEAVRQAKSLNAMLTILAVAETFRDTEHDYAGLSGANEALFTQVRRKADAVKLEAIKHGVPPTVIVEAGPSPAQNILDWAEEEDADLIVMGHREKKGLDRFLLGSVTAKVIAHAQCSVFVVR